MKYAMLSLLVISLLCACETYTDADGNEVTRFDAKGAATLIDTGFNAYDRYNRASHIIGYAPDGTPIYGR